MKSCLILVLLILIADVAHCSVSQWLRDYFKDVYNRKILPIQVSVVDEHA